MNQYCNKCSAKGTVYFWNEICDRCNGKGSFQATHITHYQDRLNKDHYSVQQNYQNAINKLNSASSGYVYSIPENRVTNLKFEDKDYYHKHQKSTKVSINGGVIGGELVRTGSHEKDVAQTLSLKSSISCQNIRNFVQQNRRK